MGDVAEVLAADGALQINGQAQLADLMPAGLDARAPALQASGLSEMLHASVWLYPLVNTGHLLGMALLFGAIVVLDLRLNGLWRQVPAALLARVLDATARRERPLP